jgi:catechol 2,3-dioxygenase-like lactoylglutathione lyase family enzyme
MRHMASIQRLNHVGITVTDLDTASAFFIALGLEVEGPTLLEGEFLDTVIGISNSRTEIVVLPAPDGGAGVELARFIRPDHQPGSPAAMATELGLRAAAFEVDDVQALVERLAEDGYGLVGGIGEYGQAWRMGSVRGPEGIIVSLTERIGGPLRPPAPPSAAP